MAFSKLKAHKGNAIKTNNTLIRKSQILISGNNSLIDILEADIYNSTIRIVGEGNTITIGKSVRVYNMNIQVNAHNSIVEIGNATHFGGGTIVCCGDKNEIRIGKDCMISENVDIWNSDTHIITINGNDIVNASPVIIGDHVWLGKGVTVLKGVTIGSNAIVGMKSVVTHSLRSGTINAGCPAGEIRDGANWRK